MAIQRQFLVSFMVDARGGAMRGCRHSGVRVIIPPRKASMPMRITCRYLKKDKLVHAPPLMEGEALASRILEMGPSGAKFLGPVIIEVPHFASLRGKEREIVILRSDNGETWREHTLEATEEAVQEVLNESFDGEELKQLEDLNTSRITRVLTTDFPQYFAIVTRIRQEVHAIGPEGGMVSSTVVPQVQAVFPQGALTKKIKVGLQAQPISPDLVAKLLGNRVAVSSIVTVEPRRRKFHKPITLTIPVPQAASKGMINQYSGEAPTLRLLCSITGGTTRAQWEDVTGSTPLTFVNDCVSFTTTVSARFWLMDCTNIPEATKMATELYREAIHVPFMAKFVVFSKRHQLEEARVRVFCMTDDKEDKTLETQENFSEVAKSRDVEVLEGKSQHLEFAGNLIPVTKSGDQLGFNFYAFKENRLPFTVRVKDQNGEPAGRVAFMRQPKVGRGDPPQTPICTLNLSLPENVLPEPAPSEPDLLALEKKYTFLSINKTDTIHKADLRLSDISNMLGSDWVFLANELDINESDANIIKSQYPNNAPQQAIVMLRLWMQTQGNKATGNSLEKGLRTIGRVDIVDECISNLELVTDDIERAMATERLEKPDIDSMKPEITPIPNSSLNRDASMDVSYDEKDIMKDAESADEEEEGIRSSMVHFEATEIHENIIEAEPRTSSQVPTSQVVVEDFDVRHSTASNEEEDFRREEEIELAESRLRSEQQPASPVEILKEHPHEVIEDSPVEILKEHPHEVIEDSPVEILEEHPHEVIEDSLTSDFTTTLKSAPLLEEEEPLVHTELVTRALDDPTSTQEDTDRTVDSYERESVDEVGEVIHEEATVVESPVETYDERVDEVDVEDFEVITESEVVSCSEVIADKEQISDSEVIADSEVAEESIVIADSEVAQDSVVIADSEAITDSEVIADSEVIVDSVFIADSEVAEDSIAIADSEVEQDSNVIEDSEVAEGSVVIPDSEVAEDSVVIADSEVAEDSVVLSDSEIVVDSKVADFEVIVEKELAEYSEVVADSDEVAYSQNAAESEPVTDFQAVSSSEVVDMEVPDSEVSSDPEVIRCSIESSSEPHPESETIEYSIPVEPQLIENLEVTHIQSDEMIELSIPEELEDSHSSLTCVDDKLTNDLVDLTKCENLDGVPTGEFEVSSDTEDLRPIATGEITADTVEDKVKTDELPEDEILIEEAEQISPTEVKESPSFEVPVTYKEAELSDSERSDEHHELDNISGQGEITQASVVQIDEGSMDTSSKKVPSAAADVETPAVQASIVAPQHSQEERGTKDQTSEDEDGVSKEDVGVVFTEPKESWGGVKLPSETTSGQIHAQPIPSSHTFSPPLQDDSRPQRRHERTYSQASNIVSKNNYAASTETESSVESDIGPYSERKQFWEKVSSFESKSPFGKGETESDTDTGTDGTVIEKDLSFAEVSESAHESTEKKAEGRFGESKEASIPSDIHDLISVTKKEASRDLPSPDDISLKDVKTRKEVFEKEIQNQAAAAENGWKRSSKDYSDQHGIPEQKTQSITVESSITSKDSSFLREKEIIKLRSETESDMEKIKTRENTDREHSETTDSTSKELFSFKKVKEDEVETTTEQELKSDLRKQILEDEQENKKKTVTKSKDGLVTKSDAKETTKAYAETTHKEQDDKSQTFVKDKDGRESTVTFAEKSLHSSDRKEFHHSKAFTSHKKMRDISSEGDTSKTSSSETTESTDDSFDFNEATKKHTQAPQSHSECSTDDESKKIVEKKIEEERRTIGNIEEILVRETTTTREGDQEQRVVKETKTQETNLPDGSTVKTTSVTTFTTNLDTNDSDYSDGSSSAVLGREKLEGKLKQLSIDDVFPAELHSDELTPEDAGKKVLLSPIHIPEEENVEEVVWEVSQQVSEVLEPETVQNIPDELNAESSDISKKDNKNIDVPLKLILTEEDARKVAADIVEEVKYEALKRSPVRITREDVADETTSFFQVQPHDEQFNELHLIESIAAKKAEMQRNKLGMTDCQLSLEITDEDLKSSYAELSPIEHQMEKLRLMTEDDDPIKAYNEPSEADESESSIIIHDCLEESFTSGYDQANKMFNQTLDALKTTSLNKVERSIDTISEESTKPELEEIDPKKRKDDLTETAMQIIKEVTEKAIESETLKQVSSVKSNLAPHTDYKIKLIKDDLLKHERSLDVLMESSMTESVEECSAAESTRAYDSKFVTEFTKTTIPEMTEQEDVTVQKDRPLVQPEIVKMRKKSHIDEFNRRSGTDFDAYSSSGESHYFTAAEGTDSRSVSRPCSSDADLLLSATPGTSEYDTALTSQEGSQYTLSSQDFSTAPSSISSRDSMKSVDSESSGHLGSIELSSEASETLVPSTLDLEKDMELLDKEILEEEMMLSRSSSSNIPELTLFTGTPKSEELPSSMENDSDISEPSEEAMSPLVSSKMKRSMEMTFHPEPKVLLGEEIPITGLDESTISENSAITVIEIDKNILETSVSDTNMSSSNVSENIQLCTDTKNTSTENLPVASKVQGMDEGSTPNAVTITTTSVPSSDPDASKTTMCTQVTSEGNENSFFRTSGLAEIEKVSSQNGELIRRLAAAPATNEVGTAGSHSASPESLIIDSSKPEVDQYLEEDGISFSRKGMFFDEREDAYRNLSSSDPFERPKTPEPGSRSHLVLQSSEDTEDMTEVDKRFSAIFSVTYEEPESPSPLLKISSNSVPDITVTEHMAPVNEKHRYPDLESETEFPECFTQYGADSRTSTSPATSPKSSTTDSEHEREYCLEGQVSLPVDESFEFINVDDVYDTTEFQSTLMHHEHRLKDIAARNDRDESSDSGNIGDSPGILPVTIKAVKLDSLSPSDSENFGLDDMAKTLDDSAFNSSIEEQRRWLEMQFEENGIQSSYEFSQQNFGEHVFAGPLEDIEEERDDFERRDLSHVTKTPSLSSTPEYDVLAGRRFFTRSGDNDDISVSSLQEFETLEKVVSGEMGARRSSSGSQESLNGKQPGNGQKSAHGDDISVSSFSSLNEFERLEKECLLVEIEDKIKVEEQILSEIEEGHESQVSESESCETMSEAEEESPSNYEQKIFEIDEIIRQAQSNVENFEKEGVLLRDIVGISESTDERTPSAEPQDSLEEAAPSGEHKDKFEKSMAASTDSLESKSNMGTVLKKPDQMSASMDSLESARRDLMATSADSLGKDDSSGRDGDVSSGSERIYHRQGGPMEWSTDSLEPTSSQATHALCHYETDSMMSGSFTSGCSNTLMPTAEESSEFMSSGIYLQEGDFTEDYSDSKYDWRSGSFTEGLVREIVEESTEPEFSHTLTRTVVMPPKIEKVTFKGQDAEQQLEKYIEQFNVGEHSSETETVDAAGNVHIQRVVHKRMIIDPDVARETGLFSDTPEAPKGEPVNVESNVDQTVISISSMGIDAGKPVINTKILTSTLPSSSHISISPLSTHPSGPPSGLHSPREPPPTSLEPNTASEYSLDESTQEESK